MNRRISRRKFFGLSAAAGCAALAAESFQTEMPGQILTPTEFYNLPQLKEYGAYPTTYIPQNLRQKNMDGSCVHLATAVCLISIGEYQLAADWTSSYSRGEYSSRHLRRMQDKGLLFAVEVNGDPAFIDFWVGNTNQVAKRCLGVSYFTRHVMNVLDVEPANHQNPTAYLLNNQGRSAEWNWNSDVAAEVPRENFLRNWDRQGGWAFAVLGTSQKGVLPPNPPYPYI